jgi:hypothetical protein
MLAIPSHKWDGNELNFPHPLCAAEGVDKRSDVGVSKLTDLQMTQ